MSNKRLQNVPFRTASVITHAGNMVIHRVIMGNLLYYR